MATVLAAGAGNTFYFAWEVRLMEILQSIVGDFGTTLFGILTMFGEELICVAVMGLFYWGIDKEIGKLIGINTVVNLIWNPMVKNVALRRRPYFDNPEIKILKPVDAEADIYDIAAQGYSFPSGHSSNATLVYGSAALGLKKKWALILGWVVPFLVGVSRFVLGAHYPTDVLAGWGMGLIILIFIPLIRKKLKCDALLYAILLVTGIPGFFYCTTDDFYTGYGIMLGALLGFLFEEKFVNFSNTKNVFRVILRTVLGGGLFLGLNTVLKLPFSEAFLDSGTLGAHLVRTGRYALVVFIVVAIYPMFFRPKKASDKAGD